MNRIMYYILLSFTLVCTISCKKGIEQQNDKLYSRHLQREVKLQVLFTAPPDDRSDFQLLLVNDAKVAKEARLAEIADSLYKAKEIQTLVIVVVDGLNAKHEYGVADYIMQTTNGQKADHYDSFIHNELYPYAKKKAGVRKFKSVAITGFETGAVSALDIAWTHSDKISKVGLFSPAFDKVTGSEISNPGGAMYEKLRNSRKRPSLQYWICGGGHDSLSNNAMGQVVEVLASKSFVSDTDIVFEKIAANHPGNWAGALPDFLKWVIK